jgi:hypothetical protein
MSLCHFFLFSDLLYYLVVQYYSSTVRMYNIRGNNMLGDLKGMLMHD